VDSKWRWWITAAGIAIIPVSFFVPIGVGLSVAAARAEKGLGAEEKQRRHRAAWRRVGRDVAPLISRPEPMFRLFARAWELWRGNPPSPPTDTKRRPPKTDGSAASPPRERLGHTAAFRRLGDARPDGRSCGHLALSA
jgi:hypothetical protein